MVNLDLKHFVVPRDAAANLHDLAAVEFLGNARVAWLPGFLLRLVTWGAILLRVTPGEGLPVRKPVDDLCKGAVNLCAT